MTARVTDLGEALPIETIARAEHLARRTRRTRGVEVAAVVREPFDDVAAPDLRAVVDQAVVRPFDAVIGREELPARRDPTPLSVDHRAQQVVVVAAVGRFGSAIAPRDATVA